MSNVSVVTHCHCDDSCDFANTSTGYFSGFTMKPTISSALEKLDLAVKSLDKAVDIRLEREEAMEAAEAQTRHLETERSQQEQKVASLRDKLETSRVERQGLAVQEQNVLEQLKATPDLRRIPVIILSSSRADRDITESYDRYANGYITKPDEFGAMRDVVEAIEDFWFGAATLPDRH